MDEIISFDKQLLVYLNGFGSTFYDPFWLFITKQSNWIPFFLFLLFLVYKKLGTQQTAFIMLYIAVLLTLNNEMTEFFKAHFQRIRPCNDPIIKDIIRNLKPSNTFSFFSGHSSNTMAVFVFVYLIFKKKYNYFGLIVFWPLFFAYSRIYLGLHFPLDILAGYLFGSFMGFIFYKIYVNRYNILQLSRQR